MTTNSVVSDSRCQWQTADGRQCRMLRKEGHPTLCAHHAREEDQLLAAETLGDDLASLSGHFKTAQDVNHVLGKIFTALAENRISAQTAVTFALHSCQLLLQTLPTVRKELDQVTRDFSGWTNMLRKAFPKIEPSKNS